MCQNSASSEGSSSSPSQPESGPNMSEPAGKVAPRSRFGRWVQAMLLGLILGAIGGTAAHGLVKDRYASTGTIQIKPYLKGIIYKYEQNLAVPMFDSYVETQAFLLRSPRMILLAMDSPQWKAAVQKARPLGLDAFTERLAVTRPPNSKLIQVSFNDQDPQLAAAAVRAVLDAYLRVASENDTDMNNQKLKILEDRRATLVARLKALNDRVMGIANEFGTDSLERFYNPKLEEYNKFQSSLAEAEIALAYASTNASATSAPAGLLATAPSIAGADSNSDAVRHQAEIRVAELRARSERAKTELLDIGRKELTVRAMKTEIESVQKDVDETKSRIDQLGIESAVGGRIAVLSSGDLPFRPVSRRSLSATIAGSAVGLGLGFGIIGLGATIGRRRLPAKGAR
jgi:uncharacterized protein involved in exopolysaccharide biosynthesis